MLAHARVRQQTSLLCPSQWMKKQNLTDFYCHPFVANGSFQLLYAHSLWFRLLERVPFSQAGLLPKFPVFFHNEMISSWSYQQISFKNHSALLGSLPFHGSFLEETASLLQEKATVNCPEADLPSSFPRDPDLHISWLLHLKLITLFVLLIHSNIKVILKCQDGTKIWRVLILIVKQVLMPF